jgi:hypothetical protein
MVGAALWVLLMSGSLARAGDAFYLGAWKISGAEPAPWAASGQMPDAAERSRLLGKTINFKAGEISGPAPFACKRPRYKLSEFTPQMIFQGAFEEMQSNDKSVDPSRIAASLGFKARIRTLETGCELDFHFVDEARAKTGLNDYIYELEKQ